jgi:arsenate reductase
MNVDPLEIIRTGESLFKELGHSKSDIKTRQAWLKIMVANPKLIERPIVKIGNRVVIGRPPEKVLDILK